jgi:Neuraminidase (sialidase)
MSSPKITRARGSLGNVATARARGFPHGFTDKAQYDAFMTKVQSALTSRKIPADNVHVHGSAIHSKAPNDIDIAVIVDEATFNDLGAKFKAAAPDKKSADAITADMKKGKISSPSFYPKVKPTAAQDAGTVGALGAQVSVIKAGSEFDVGPYLNR